MQHPKFIEGDFDTNFISTYFTPEGIKEQDQSLLEAAALFSYLEFNEHKIPAIAQQDSNWKKRKG